jgi:hypothetical protein
MEFFPLSFRFSAMHVRARAISLLVHSMLVQEKMSFCISGARDEGGSLETAESAVHPVQS